MSDPVQVVPLWEKMRTLADTLNDAEQANELYVLAENLETKVNLTYLNTFKDDDIKAMLSAWAKARLLYCKITGEPLL